MILLGLTGSLAMGKSTAARILVDLGWRLHDSDAAVHRLYARGGAAVAPLEALVPGVTHEGAVHRPSLAQALRHNPQLLPQVERLVHALVKADRDAFVRQAQRRGWQYLVFDVPLLFETGLDAACDFTLVVTAPSWLQRRRALSRPGMTPEKLAFLLGRQWPDTQKRKGADFVVSSGAGKARMRRDILAVLAKTRLS